MSECVVVGGGIIGLAIAEELAVQGIDVDVVEFQSVKHSASWAAAGILPPPVTRAIHDPLEQMRDLSHRIYPDWCHRLAESGLSVDLHRCGGIYLARTPGEQVALAAALDQWETGRSAGFCLLVATGARPAEQSALRLPALPSGQWQGLSQG